MVKASMSWPAAKLVVIDTVAEDKLVLSMSASVNTVLMAVAASFSVYGSVDPLTSVGASFTAATLSCTCTGEADSAPTLSLATTVKAFSVPLTLLAGVQKALRVASTTSLVPAAQAVAPAAVAPINSVPVLTALTMKALTVPSASASLPCAAISAKVMVAWLSSATVFTAAAMVVSVGVSLTAATLTFWVPAVLLLVPSFTVKLTVRVAVLGDSELLL